MILVKMKHIIIVITAILALCSFASADILIYPQNATYYTDNSYNGSLIINNSGYSDVILNNSGWSLSTTSTTEFNFYNSDTLYGLQNISFAYRDNLTYDPNVLVDVDGTQNGEFSNYLFYNGEKRNGTECSSGQCIFDGVKEYIYIGDYDYPYMTVIAWVNTSLTADRHTVLAKRPGGLTSYRYTIETTQKPVISLQTAAGVNTHTYSTAIPTNEWHMVTYMWDGDNATVCVDNDCETWDSTNDGEIVTSADIMVIGTRTPGSNDDMFKGEMDSMMIYNRSLSRAEITEQYNAGRSGFPINGHKLVHSFTMNSYDQNSTHIFDTNNLVSGRGTSRGLNLKGDGYYINLTDNSDYNVGDEISMCAWLKPEEFSFMILSKQVANGYEFWVDNSGRLDCVISNGAGSGINCNVTNSFLVIDTWSHVCFTVNTTNDKVTQYINGAQTYTETLTGIASMSNANTLSIGERLAGTFDNYNGTMDDLMIWDKALTASEVDTVYDGWTYNHYDSIGSNLVSYFTGNIEDTSGFSKSDFWFYLNTTLEIYFYDESSNTLIDGTQIDFSLISSSLSGNYSTTNGFYNFSDLIPGEYQIRYDASNYILNNYYVTLTGENRHVIYLYLLNSSLASALDITVQDFTLTRISNVTLYLERYYTSINDGKVVSMGRTSQQGEKRVYVEQEKGLYKITATYGGSVIYQSSSWEEFVSSEYKITTDINNLYTEWGDVTGNLNVHNDTPTVYFNYTYTGKDTNVATVCLQVYLEYYGNLTLINTTCATATATTITQTIERNNTYVAYVYINQTDGTVIWKASKPYYGFDAIEDFFWWKFLGLTLALILAPAFILASIKITRSGLGGVIATDVMILAIWKLQIIPISIWAIGLFIPGSIVIMYYIDKNILN